MHRRTTLVVLGVALLAGPAEGARRRDCRAACGDAIHACVASTGRHLRRCKQLVVNRCRREGLVACRQTAPVGVPCQLGKAPACNGSCPAEFSCVPNPFGGCNCEAAACGVQAGRVCGGVCEDGLTPCLPRGAACACR